MNAISVLENSMSLRSIPACLPYPHLPVRTGL